MSKVKRKGNKVTKYSDHQYTQADKKIMKVTDNGNGYTIKIYSWSSTEADTYHSLGYADAADFVDCFNKFEDK